MNLNQEISLKRKSKYPEKTSINLAQLNEDPGKKKRTWALFGVYVVGLLVFVHFGVFNQIRKINELEAAYHTAENQLSALQESNSDYDEVRAQYSHYGNGYLNDEEAVLQDRMDILDVVEKDVENTGALVGLSVSGNTAQLQIDSQKLANVSEIVSKLESEDIVSYVTVSTSATNNANYSSESTDSSRTVLTTLTVTFKDAVSEEEGESE